MYYILNDILIYLIVPRPITVLKLNLNHLGYGLRVPDLCLSCCTGYTLHKLNDRRHGDPKQDPMYRDIFLAGGIAGAVQAIPACPIELVKVKLQVQKGSNLYPISN